MNILFIVVDDLGWNDVGYHGSEIKTPTLDSLASEGVKLEHFYTLQACTPTRTALMTGLYPMRMGMQCIVWPWSDYGLSPEVPTLADHLKRAGYTNYLVGKWHLGHNKAEYLPLSRGFDYHHGNYTGSIGYYSHKVLGIHDYFENGTPIYPEGHVTDICADKAVELIGKHDYSRPMFMYLAFNAPHVPLEAPEGYLQRYIDLPSPRREFAAMVSHLDDAIARVRDALAAAQQLDNTLIWFTSDNGGWLGNGGDNRPYRGGKITNYEGGLRVPSFIRHPSLKPSVFGWPCHVVDVVPTLCQVVKQSIPYTIDGVDLTPYLQGAQAPIRPILHHFVQNETGFSGAMTVGDWKFMKYKEVELYNLGEDPHETVNRAETMPQVTADLTEKLKAYGKFYRPEPLVRWVPPNGYPEGYELPRKYWSEPDPAKIKMLEFEKDTRDLNQCELIELLGLAEYEPQR